jgi:hypothetical protein
MMRRRWPVVARVFAWSALAVLPITQTGSTTPASVDRPSATQGESPETRLPPEVRLRKLHLVRPDLIQYPIYYEVYC